MPATLAPPTAPAPKPVSTPAPPPASVEPTPPMSLDQELSHFLESGGEMGPNPEPVKKPAQQQQSSSSSSAPQSSSSSAQPKDKPQSSSSSSAPPKPEKAAERLRMELEERNRRVKDLESKLSETEKALSTKAQDLEKRYQEAQATLRDLDYQRSDEYRDKYHKPIENVFKDAHELMAELTITGPDGTTVQAEPKHFNQLAQIQSASAARAQAKELWGEDAESVMHHYRRLRGLFTERNRALETFRTEAEQRAQSKAAQAIEQKQNAIRNFEAARKSLEELPDFKDRFTPDPNDPEDATRIERASKFANAIFLERDKLPPEQVLKADALAHTWIRDYPRTRMKLDKATERIKALEAELDTYRNKSEPGAGTSNQSRPEAEKSIYDELRESLSHAT